MSNHKNEDLNEMSEDLSFEKDLQKAIRLHQRSELKKVFQSIDDEDLFEITDDEMKLAVVNAGRSALKDQFTEVDRSDQGGSYLKLIIRYAMAAAVVGIVIGGLYLRFFNEVPDPEESLVVADAAVKNPSNVFNGELGNMPDSSSYRKDILYITQPSGSGGGIVSKRSITLNLNILEPQLNRLRNLAVIEEQDIDSAGSQQYRRVRHQIDSLGSLRNTYFYSDKNGILVLNLFQPMPIDKMISIDDKKFSRIYLKSSASYFQILDADSLQPLIQISDKGLIEKIRRVEERQRSTK